LSFTFDPLIGGMQTVLDLRMAQHSLTASNLANADTPGYRAKVIDFRHVLAQAVGTGSPLQQTDARHLQGRGLDPNDLPITELEPEPWSLDGNSVLSERETARMTENSLMYDAVSRGIDRKLALLAYAMSDGRS
jgi:flagellar basal-body rod protein FlgB